MVKAIIGKQINAGWREKDVDGKRMYARWYEAVSADYYRPLVVIFLYDSENSINLIGVEILAA